MLAIIFNAITIQRKPTLTDKDGDGAGLRVGGAAGVVAAVRLLHAGYHQSAAGLAAALA